MAPDPRRLFEVKNISTALSQIGVDGEGADLEDEFCGGECHIFKIKTSKSGNLAVRVPLYMGNDPDCAETKIEALKSELRSLRALEAKRFPWSPRCLGESLTFDNPVRHPFLVLSWIEGAPLAWSEKNPPRAVRDQVLGQLAAIHMALVECSLEITGAEYNLL